MCLLLNECCLGAFPRGEGALWFAVTLAALIIRSQTDHATCNCAQAGTMLNMQSSLKSIILPCIPLSLYTFCFMMPQLSSLCLIFITLSLLCLSSHFPFQAPGPAVSYSPGFYLCTSPLFLCCIFFLLPPFIHSPTVLSYLCSMITVTANGDHSEILLHIVQH